MPLLRMLSTILTPLVDVFQAKTDIKSAFQIIPVRPQDYNLQGMRWHEAYFYDCYMPMGRSSSCKTFENFSTALEGIATSQLSISHIIHLLDYFLITAPTHALCQNQLNLFLDLCSYLSVPTPLDKTLGPSTRGLSNTHKQTPLVSVVIRRVSIGTNGTIGTNRKAHPSNGCITEYASH